MEQSELLKHLASTLDQMGVPYLVTGSMASIAYGEPRFTNDIDVVVALPVDKVPALCAAFPAPDYHCSEDSALKAVRDGFQFNILSPASGLKIDVIVATDSEFDRSRLARGVRLPTGEDFEVTFASAEDLIVKKLLYFQEGGSEKHLRDIVGVLEVQGKNIDSEYLNDWITKFGLESEWQLIQDRMEEEKE
ncbi:MAG: nucleotidyl transferase AbiEii/AbiGii toxin family protein [Gemmataceae bacterium]